MSKKTQKIEVNQLEVDQLATLWCNTNIHQGLNVNGNTSLHKTIVNGDLEVTGCIIAQADLMPQTVAEQRRLEAYRRRVQMATAQYQLPLPVHVNNGDETLYSNRIACFHKGLPHDANGIVNATAYSIFLDAIVDPTKFDNIPRGGTQKLINPLAGVAYDTEGADSHSIALPPAPTLASAEHAGEMVELYWMALLRDVKFSDYPTDPTVAQAVSDLNNMTDYRGPRDGGLVTPQTLFRGTALGCTVGPYLSQFFYKDCRFGANVIEQKIKVPIAGTDFMTDWPTFLSIENGVPPLNSITLQPNARYMITGRDLSHWVHIDVLFQAYFHAGLILHNIGCPVNVGNPYKTGHLNQTGFGTFGPPYFSTILCEVATRALKCVWHKKWFVHRRLRPEAYGGLVEKTLNGQVGAPLHPDLLNSQALEETFAKYNNYLLPQAFPEGSPLHPSYGAGHATVAGACVTVLKALFDTDNFNIPSPVQPDTTGDNLVVYPGTLTATGELHKIAYNVALGRDFAGVHWRSDGGLTLGEEIAISVLKDQKYTHHIAEGNGSCTFTKFNGTVVTI